MKKYIKNHIIIVSGTPIQDGDKVYYNPTDDIYKQHGWEEYIEPTHIKTLEEVKADKIKEIEAYDISDNVNSFIVAEEYYWVNKADRVGLMNSTNILKANGVTNATFWLGHNKYIVSCDDLISMLSQLEMYALNCYYTTESHIAAINAMDNIEDVNSYNITLNYPEKLTFNL